MSHLRIEFCLGRWWAALIISKTTISLQWESHVGHINILVACCISCEFSVALSSEAEMVIPGPARTAICFFQSCSLDWGRELEKCVLWRLLPCQAARFYLVSFQNAKENEEWELLGFAEGIFVVGLSMYMEEAAVKLGCEVSGCLEVKLMRWTVFIKVAVMELYEYLWYCCGHSQPFRVF